MLGKYVGMVRGIANTWEPSFTRIPSVDEQDLQQEAFTEVWAKYDKFDRRRGKWSTFIFNVSLSRINNFLSEQTRDKRMPKTLIYLDATTRINPANYNERDTNDNLIERLDIQSNIPTPYEILNYKQLLEIINKAVETVKYCPVGFQNGDGRTFAQHLLDEMVSPSEKLKMQIYKKQCVTEQRVESKKQKKRILQFKITESDLAKFFKINKYSIHRGIVLTRKAIIGALRRNQINYSFEKP